MDTIKHKLKISEEVFLSDQELAFYDLTIRQFSYGMWQLKQDKEIICEEERFDCNLKALKIINNLK
jgi:hypothetical protein